MHIIGEIDKEIYKCITDNIICNEVIITDTQFRHIASRHPEAVEDMMNYLSVALSLPDMILEDKHRDTGLVIKKIEKKDEYLQIVLRICTSQGQTGYKNSIISCWKISEKRLQNYMRNRKTLYKRE